MLDDNQISVIPTCISQLVSLEILSLNTNLISTLPSELFRLKKLRVLDLSNNQLTTIPKNVKRLKSLKELNLTRNRIKRLPYATVSALDEMKLNVLGISENPHMLRNFTERNFKNVKPKIFELVNNLDSKECASCKKSFGLLKKRKVLFFI